MKTIVVIPTYDERENVKKMADAVLGQPSNSATLKPCNLETL